MFRILSLFLFITAAFGSSDNRTPSDKETDYYTAVSSDKDEAAEVETNYEEEEMDEDEDVAEEVKPDTETCHYSADDERSENGSSEEDKKEEEDEDEVGEESNIRDDPGPEHDFRRRVLARDVGQSSLSSTFASEHGSFNARAGVADDLVIEDSEEESSE